MEQIKPGGAAGALHRCLFSVPLDSQNASQWVGGLWQLQKSVLGERGFVPEMRVGHQLCY